MNPRLTLRQAQSPAQIAQARELFLEYADSLGFSLCFQSFDQELAGLPGDYAPPTGRLLLAEYRERLGGLRRIAQTGIGVCEMKRLYLRPQFRGRGLGGLLAEAVIAEARAIGYRKMRLDTVEPVMPNAVAMYRASDSSRSNLIAPIRSQARCTWSWLCRCEALLARIKSTQTVLLSRSEPANGSRPYSITTPGATKFFLPEGTTLVTMHVIIGGLSWLLSL